MTSFAIGLDYGSASARGVLIDCATGREVAARTHDYARGTLTQALPDGTPLPRGWALQVATDYTEAARVILEALGRDRRVVSIGIGFTASSPLPAAADGTPLSSLWPEDPHAYVKLWKHRAAQSQADRINASGSPWLDNFGGKLSAEWLLAKAAQIADESPASWARSERFIEAGDWLVWQLTGTEARSLGLAAYKAQYDTAAGYPEGLVPGLAERLAKPLAVGSKAGELTDEWLQRTGVVGPCVVSVAVIDSHVVLPAIGAVEDGCFVGALGTSAVSLMLSQTFRPLPKGIEGVARDGSILGLWCYEAGQASFGDMLSWLVRTFPLGPTIEQSFAAYNAEASRLTPGLNHLVALDWWNGNRVPHANSDLSGLLLGLTMETTAGGVYRSLIEGLCFGMRQVFQLYQAGGFNIHRVVMTSGLAQRNPLLVQIMADVLGRDIEVPAIENATAVGAAIHGAVAAGLVSNYSEGAARFGAREALTYHADVEAHRIYDALYAQYKLLGADPAISGAMLALSKLPQSVAEGPAG